MGTRGKRTARCLAERTRRLLDRDPWQKDSSMCVRTTTLGLPWTYPCFPQSARVCKASSPPPPCTRSSSQVSILRSSGQRATQHTGTSPAFTLKPSASVFFGRCLIPHRRKPPAKRQAQLPHANLPLRFTHTSFDHVARCLPCDSPPHKGQGPAQSMRLNLQHTCTVSSTTHIRF